MLKIHFKLVLSPTQVYGMKIMNRRKLRQDAGDNACMASNRNIQVLFTI